MGYETGGGRFFKSALPRTPTRKNFDWRGGGAMGVPLTGRLKGKGSLEISLRATEKMFVAKILPGGKAIILCTGPSST